MTAKRKKREKRFASLDMHPLFSNYAVVFAKCVDPIDFFLRSVTMKATHCSGQTVNQWCEEVL